MINYVIPKTILRGTNHDRGQQTSLVQTGNKHPRHCRPLEALTYVCYNDSALLSSKGHSEHVPRIVEFQNKIIYKNKQQPDLGQKPYDLLSRQRQFVNYTNINI